MIIIHLEEMNDFASFLDKRISNEIFFEFIKPEPQLNGLKVQLQYLGALNNNNILFTTHLDFPKIKDKNAVINKLKEIKISDLDIRLVHGTIRELYFSIS
ncbi:MAG: hypothetical protein ACTSO9_11720 [Candidatus Helarchaeota archaeon]